MLRRSKSQRYRLGQHTAARLRTEVLEERRVLSADPWVLASAAESATDEEPIAEPALLMPGGGTNTDAASLLAAGGPGDPSQPGFANIGRVGNNGTAIYLGNGWALTANHVALTSSVTFGGVSYPVVSSSSERLHNPSGSSVDLKLFRVEGDPPLPEIYSSQIATAPPTGHVFMIGNGLAAGEERFWTVNKSESPWVWTEIPEPSNPGFNEYGGVTIGGSRTVRWGENSVDENDLVLSVGGSSVHGFTTQFDHPAFTGQSAWPNEAQAADGDSGGAVFAMENGEWVLSGAILAVSGSLSGQPGSTALYGNITVAADLSVYRDEILSIIGVTGRHIFYNESAFDGEDPAINAADDGAIAPDKTAYQAGSGIATFDNVTSYFRGITGIMIDVAAMPGTLTADDFIFKVGNDNAPSGWSVAPAPSAIVVRPGAGVAGTNRIEITWESGAIVNTWLEVTVKGDDALGGNNTNTGLHSSDVFYWGNKIGDSGTSTPASTFITTTTDFVQAIATLGTSKPIDDLRDYNRDGRVTTTDALISIANLGTIQRIDLPAETAEALVAEDDPADQELWAAIGGALTLTSGRQSDPLPTDRSRHALFAHPAERERPPARRIATPPRVLRPDKRFGAVDRAAAEGDWLSEISRGLPRL